MRFAPPLRLRLLPAPRRSPMHPRSPFHRRAPAPLPLCLKPHTRSARPSTLPFSRRAQGIFSICTRSRLAQASPFTCLCTFVFQSDFVFRFFSRSSSNSASTSSKAPVAAPVAIQVRSFGPAAVRTPKLSAGRKHSGEKPFACDECDYRCSLRGNLASHKRTFFRREAVRLRPM